MMCSVVIILLCCIILWCVMLLYAVSYFHLSCCVVLFNVIFFQPLLVYVFIYVFLWTYVYIYCIVSCRKREKSTIAFKNTTKLPLCNPIHNAKCSDGFKMKYHVKILRHVLFMLLNTNILFDNIGKVFLLKKAWVPKDSFLIYPNHFYLMIDELSSLNYCFIFLKMFPSTIISLPSESYKFKISIYNLLQNSFFFYITFMIAIVIVVIFLNY